MSVKYLHNKSKKQYDVHDMFVSNKTDETLGWMVYYKDKAGNSYIRDKNEFLSKFTKV